MAPSCTFRSIRSTRTMRLVLFGSCLLAACGGGDLGANRLRSLKAGTSRDEVLALIGSGPVRGLQPPDSLRLVQGYRLQKFVADGVTHEVIWYREAPATTEDPIARETDTPVVLVDDTVVGWGWRFYNAYSEKHNLPNPARDRERLDSIAASQAPKP